MPDFQSAGFVRAVGGNLIGDLGVVAGTDPGGAALVRSSGGSGIMGNGSFGANAVANAGGWARMVQSTGAGSAAFSLRDTNAPAQQWDVIVSSKKFEVYDATNSVHAMQITPATGAVAFAGGVTAPTVNASTSFTTPLVGIGAAAAPAIGLNVGNTALTGTVQVGAQVRPIFTNATTVTGRTLDLQLKTAAASFTMGIGTALHINPPNIGAGATVTEVNGIYIDAQAGGGTNYAIQSAGGLIRFAGLGGGTGLLSVGAVDSGGTGFRAVRVPN